MALSRRTGQRFQASIWPGFVDAMTGLLLVLFFVLTIFMIVQFVLRETISGQESELDALADEVAALAQTLGLERRRGSQLENELSALAATLEGSQGEVERQAALISALTQARDETQVALQAAQTRITAFEAQVAGLLNARETAQGKIAALEAEQARLISDQEALNLALSQARSEIDAGTEAARLAAARREALDALVADLRAQNLETDAQLAQTREALVAEEAARLADAAAAEALRDRLKDADSELTAMTLALEEQRKQAEETLTLLAAAEAAETDLDAKLVAALLSIEALEARGAKTSGVVEQAVDRATEAESRATEAEARAKALEANLSDALSRIDDAQTDRETVSAQAAARIASLEAQMSTLRTQMVEQAAQSDEVRQDLQGRLAAALDRLKEAQSASSTDRSELRAQLAAALAARLAAETLVQDQTSEAEKRAALLAKAQSDLEEETQVSAEAQRRAAVLNQQVAALRGQLGELQSLLDDAKERDAGRDIQMQSLGSELNTALARVAAEERRRRRAEEAQRALEEAERARLEEEAQQLAQEARQLAEEAKDLEKYRSEFFGQLRDLLGTHEGVRIVGDRFVFSSEVLFASARAELSDQGKTQISDIAGILRDVAGDIPPQINWVLQVDGHTDAVPLSGQGRYADNWELSQARALSVVKYMIEALGLPPNRLSANGFGEYQPLNPDDTPEAYAQNRRIELKFTEK